MGKKRPRAKSGTARRAVGESAQPVSKLHPSYWRRRLFRNTFTYRGDRREVRHWSVKIQHLGKRKTFSFRASDPAVAAKEACRIYKSIVTSGWRADADGVDEPPHANLKPSARSAARGRCLEPAYWAERLINRKYTEAFHENADREFSARIEHQGTSFYFPLRTTDRKVAASRAAEIYKTVKLKGWEKANDEFSRELSVAFRWADDPVAWTYTTIETRIKYEERGQHLIYEHSGGAMQVAIAEPDAGLRRALCWCVDQQAYCRCAGAFASESEALREIPRLSIHLLLVGSSIADQPGAAFAEQLKKLAPKVAILPFSSYEDSEQLFKSAPGGARGYLFRRTAPTRLLEAMAGAWEKGQVLRDKIAASVRAYFEESAAALPFGAPSRQHSNLTPREHEILALLGKGHPDKEIADLLGISTWTVHGHLKKIFEKLGAHNRTDAVVKYLHK
jgi:DNA-binding NarL/FixJ family response regulator